MTKKREASVDNRPANHHLSSPDMLAKEEPTSSASPKESPIPTTATTATTATATSSTTSPYSRESIAIAALALLMKVPSNTTHPPQKRFLSGESTDLPTKKAALETVPEPQTKKSTPTPIRPTPEISVDNPTAHEANTAKIPRPLNSFMVFRLEKQRDVIKQCPGANHRDVSKIVSKWWKELSVEGRSKYTAEAERLKREHRKLYPSYKFTPRKRVTERRAYKKRCKQFQFSTQDFATNLSLAAIYNSDPATFENPSSSTPSSSASHINNHTTLSSEKLPSIKRELSSAEKLPSIKSSPVSPEKLPSIKNSPLSSEKLPSIKSSPPSSDKLPPIKSNPPSTSVVPTSSASTEQRINLPPPSKRRAAQSSGSPPFSLNESSNKWKQSSLSKPEDIKKDNSSPKDTSSPSSPTSKRKHSLQFLMESNSSSNTDAAEQKKESSTTTIIIPEPSVENNKTQSQSQRAPALTAPKKIAHAPATHHPTPIYPRPPPSSYLYSTVVHHHHHGAAPPQIPSLSNNSHHREPVVHYTVYHNYYSVPAAYPVVPHPAAVANGNVATLHYISPGHPPHPSTPSAVHAPINYTINGRPTTGSNNAPARACNDIVRPAASVPYPYCQHRSDSRQRRI